MPVSSTALIGGAIAVILAAAVVALGRRLAARRGLDLSPWWTAPVAGLAYAAGHAALAMPAFPPSDVADRVPFLALLAAAFALVGRLLRPGPIVRGVGLLILLAATLWATLGPIATAEEVAPETKTWLAATAGVALVSWLVLFGLDAVATPGATVRTLGLASAGAAVCLVVSGTLTAGLFAGLLAFVLLAVLLASRGASAAGALPVGLSVLTALLILGFVYASLPAYPALALAATPLAGWLARIPPIRRLKVWQSVTVEMVLLAIPAAVAVGLALASAEPMGEYGAG